MYSEMLKRRTLFCATRSVTNARYFRQVWFQNQRAKMKKMQKKARQDNKAAKDPESDEKKLNVKEEDPSTYILSPSSNCFLIDCMPVLLPSLFV